MSDFKIAYEKFIKPFEGGYADIAQDKGGETYAGISRIKFPQWEGWRQIDYIKQAQASVGKTILRNAIFLELQPLVDSFYLGRWNSYQLSKIQNQNVASLLFDYIIHSGSTKAISAIQKIVSVNADGIIGTKTLSAINKYNSAKLFSRLLSEREKFLRGLVATDSSQSVFLNGWMNRIATFKKLLPSNIAGGAIVAIALITLIIIS